MVQQLEITTHPMEDVATEIETLLATLRMELDVAPTDRVAHLDLLTRIKKVADKGQQLAYPKDEVLLAISSSKNDETWEVEDDDPTQLITIVEDEEEFAPEIEELRQKGWQIMTKSQMSERVERLRKEREKSQENSQ